MFGRPWLIVDHYLLIQEWQPNYDLEHASINSVRIWIRIPNLPMEYFDSDFLVKVGRKIGRPVQVDDNTCAWGTKEVCTPLC